MKYKFIVALDPSGAFFEGKGTTGYSVYHVPDNRFIEAGVIKAQGHICAESYWDKHLKFLNDFSGDTKIILITNILDNPQMYEYNIDDINSFSKSINSLMLVKE